ncbi:MAG: thiamine diphosphokinase [Prevotella sp.]|nr:thiamine diphosphokinase [Prevotella sp.]MBR1556156.1 thiamine diphosphokinase [Prevotella sp.]
MRKYPLIDRIKDYDAVVLADGEFPSAQIPQRLLNESPFVCACDGAIGNFPEADVVVGDGDSVPEDLRHLLIKIDEQEDNDLTKSTRYCLSKGMNRIVYLGATGKREDHTLGNISLIVRYFCEMGVEPILVTDCGWFVAAKGDSEFESFPGQQVSIFNAGCKCLSSEGLKWKSYPYSQLWQGTLNEALSTTFRLKADNCYLVYRTFS